MQWRKRNEKGVGKGTAGDWGEGKGGGGGRGRGGARREEEPSNGTRAREL